MSSQFANYDLDLEELESVKDPQRLVQIFSALIDADCDYKIFPARMWVENFLYYSGMNSSYSRTGTSTVTGNSVMPFGMSHGSNSTSRRKIPKTFKAVQIMAANLTKERPGIKVWPSNDDEISYKEAKTSDILLDYLWDVDSEEDTYYQMALWALLSPAVGRKDYLDYSFNKSRLWPKFDPILGPDGKPMSDPQSGQPLSQPRMGQNGQPVLEQLPWNKSEVISAFRLIFNPTADWINELEWVGHVAVKRKGWIEQNYLRQEEGYYPKNVANVKKGVWKFTATMALENALKQLTFGTFRSYRNFNYSQPVLKDGVTFATFCIKPSPSYPMGRQVDIAGEQLLYDGAFRGYRDEPMRWHDYSFLCYERVPGRLWGTTYAEKITDINRAYEQARSEFDMLRRTFSKPKMALPIGCEIDNDTITGDEQVFRYNPFGPDGGKPSFMNAPQPPTTIIDDTKMIEQDFTTSSGITQVQMGMHPTGATTFREVEILKEESNNASNNFIRMYEKAIQISQRNKLENLKDAIQYPDKNLINCLKIFKKMTKSLTDLDIKDFTGLQLSGYVKIEPYSTISKSKLAMQERYITVAGMGVLGDIANDPDLNLEFKRKMDITGFERPENKQVVFARYENQQMLGSEEKGIPVIPQVNPWDDHYIHSREVMSILLDPINQNKPLIMQAAIQHWQAHQQAIQIQMAVQAQQQAQMQMQNQGLAGQQKNQKPQMQQNGQNPIQKTPPAQGAVA